MTEKELKKLNRYQLLELLIMQTERADDLQKRLDELERIVRTKEFRMTKLGSIAQASLQISGVLEAAQKSADLYLEAAHAQAEDILQTAKKQAEAIIVQAEKKARFLTIMQEESTDRF